MRSLRSSTVAALLVVGPLAAQSPRDTTRSAAQTTVPDSQFPSGAIFTPQQLLANVVPGVQVIGSNQPGGTISIVIRGPRSSAFPDQPLYVLDGVPLGFDGGLSAGSDPLNFINPEDVESITVLRDAAAAAIYGGNAANGVVLITTKSGRGRATVEYGGSFMAASPTRLPAVLTAAQYRAAVSQYHPGADTLLGNANTDWFSLIDRTATGQMQHVALSGGGTSHSYRLSLGYGDLDGTLGSSFAQRLTLGGNLDQRFLNDRLDLKVNVRGARSLDHFTPAGVINSAAWMGPTQPAVNPAAATGYYNWPTPALAAPDNPLEILNTSSDRATTQRGVGNVALAYDLAGGLTASANVGLDVSRATRVAFFPNDIHAETKSGENGSFSKYEPNETGTVVDVALGFAPPGKVGVGRLSITGGYEHRYDNFRGFSSTLTNLTSNEPGSTGFPPSAAPPSSSLGLIDFHQTSFFARTSYDIADRYFASVSIRHDRTSRLAPGNDAVYFPAVSVGWETVPQLTLRASWGRTGNQDFGAGFAILDPATKWETATAGDLGADYHLWGRRLTGSIDWYTAKTENVIGQIPVLLFPNFVTLLTTNVGSFRNTGVELSLDAVLRTPAAPGGLSWTANLVASQNRNRVLSVLGNGTFLTGPIGGGVGSSIQVVEAGQPINAFYVCRQVYAGAKPAEGDYYSLTGDSVLAGCSLGVNTRAEHDPSPRWIFGLTNSFTVGRFDLGVTFRAWLGNYIYNNAAAALGNYQALSSGSAPFNLDASVLKTGFTTEQLLSDYYVENGSFLRVDHLSIGYSFPWRQERLRLYVSMQNLLTITGYSGPDPTTAVNGIDAYLYPPSRIITGGLTAQF